MMKVLRLSMALVAVFGLVQVVFATDLRSKRAEPGAVAQKHAGYAAKSKRLASPVLAAVPMELTPEQLALGDRVVLGRVACELSNFVEVSAHGQHAGHFWVLTGQHQFLMAPVVTTTGAVRLEDPVGGAMWLQLANKSMLLDQKRGRRLADVCMNADQAAVVQAMQLNPLPDLLEPLPKERASLVGATN